MTHYDTSPDLYKCACFRFSGPREVPKLRYRYWYQQNIIIRIERWNGMDRIHLSFGTLSEGLKTSMTLVFVTHTGYLGGSAYAVQRICLVEARKDKGFGCVEGSDEGYERDGGEREKERERAGLNDSGGRYGVSFLQSKPLGN